jgi:hypothetical protein
MLGQVLGDQPAFRENHVWAASGWFYADYGRFAEGVDGFELGRGEVRFRVPVEDG